MNQQALERLQSKTPEQRFLQILQEEYHQPPRIAQALLEEAQHYLGGSGTPLHPGQMRVILTAYDAKAGQSLRQAPKAEVAWTLDAGLEDRQVEAEHGAVALRRVRLQRLADEALAQNGVATEEDLAQALHVSVRTIKRDVLALQQQGVLLPTRGHLQGIGRGQTHKARIVALWLQGNTYDQIARLARHSLSAIARYLHAFVQVVELAQQGFGEEEIALLVSSSLALVREYLAVYAHEDAPASRARLAAHQERLLRGVAPKRGAR